MGKRKYRRPKRDVDYQHSCQGKYRFKSFTVAQASTSHRDFPMRVYRCQYCHNWHTTSKAD